MCTWARVHLLTFTQFSTEVFVNHPSYEYEVNDQRKSVSIAAGQFLRLGSNVTFAGKLCSNTCVCGHAYVNCHALILCLVVEIFAVSHYASLLLCSFFAVLHCVCVWSGTFLLSYIISVLGLEHFCCRALCLCLILHIFAVVQCICT